MWRSISFVEKTGVLEKLESNHRFAVNVIPLRCIEYTRESNIRNYQLLTLIAQVDVNPTT
jgi:hypothetical protein